MSIQRLTELAERNKRGVVYKYFSDSDSFPSVLDERCTSFAIVNSDTSALSFTLTYVTGSTISGEVPAGYTYDAVFDAFDKIEITGSAFNAEVRR